MYLVFQEIPCPACASQMERRSKKKKTNNEQQRTKVKSKKQKEKQLSSLRDEARQLKRTLSKKEEVLETLVSVLSETDPPPSTDSHILHHKNVDNTPVLQPSTARYCCSPSFSFFSHLTYCGLYLICIGCDPSPSTHKLSPKKEQYTTKENDADMTDVFPVSAFPYVGESDSTSEDEEGIIYHLSTSTPS